MEAGDDEWSSVVTIVLVGLGDFSAPSGDSVNSTSFCIHGMRDSESLDQYNHETHSIHSFP